MNDCNSEKNRTVKTKSAHLAGDRRGRKIPKEIFKSNVEASNGIIAWRHGLPSQREVIDRFFGHSHVMNEEQRRAFIESVQSIQGDFVRHFHPQPYPIEQYYYNRDDEIPF